MVIGPTYLRLQEIVFIDSKQDYGLSIGPTYLHLQEITFVDLIDSLIILHGYKQDYGLAIGPTYLCL